MGDRPRLFDFKSHLERKMDEMQEKNGLKRRGRFIHEDYLQTLFISEDLRERLRVECDYGQFSPFGCKKLVNLEQMIRNEARKLYAILILLEESGRIRNLIERAFVTDDVIFTEPRKGFGAHCTRESLSHIDGLSDIANKFYETQWVFPPFLSADSHQHFPPTLFVFPFTSKPSAISGGSYGTVYEIEIAKGYLEFPKEYPEGGIVYKGVQAKETKKQGWQRILNEVRTLQERRHENINPLLASFAAGRERPYDDDDDDEFLYMISPHASMDMKQWMWMKQPRYLKTEAERREHIYETMLGLSSGLAYIHQEIGGNFGFHRDLKPDNILLFETPSPMWKICDFGLSNLKDPKVGTGTSNPAGTLGYAPPEFFVQNGHKHGRAYDVFSLGCMFTELVTILKFGWTEEGLSTYRDRRIKYNNRSNPNDEREDWSFHSSLEVVEEWIMKLGENTDEIFRKVLDLTKEMLDRRAKRIFSWEVDVDLYGLVGPDTSEAGVIKRLKKVVQSSDAYVSGLHMQHNPLVRAKKRHGTSNEFLMILRARRWSDEFPGSTGELRRRIQHVGYYYSTLPELNGGTPLYGRQDLGNQISKGFGKSDSVALYGFGGIGKSHVAFHYALQFRDTTEKEERKHTFWIKAQSLSSMHNSFQDIAYTLKLPYSQLKGWFEDDSNGPWFMVVDGIDRMKEVEEIQKLLPRGGAGQILFTTRSRALVEPLVPLEKDEACIQVDRLGPDESLKVFRHHVGEKLFDQKAPHQKELLDLLWLPLLIVKAAKHLTHEQMSCREMYDSLKADRFAQIESFEPGFLDYLLKPLLQSTQASANREREPSLRLLYLIACFSIEGVEFKLIKANYPDKENGEVYKKLGTLMNTAFIKKDDSSSPKYIMSEFVQASVLECIRRNNSTEGILQRYQTALGTMYNRWRNDINQEIRNRNHSRTRSALQSSYERKLPFMPHFEQFVTFMNTSRLKDIPPSFQFSDKAAKAVAIFSSVYLEKGRHIEAIQVLEFTRRYHKGKQRYAIGRNLFKAYISRLTDQDQEKAERLLRELLKDAEEFEKDMQKWKGNSIRKWELLLDEMRLYCRLRMCDEACKKFEDLDRINLGVKKGKPIAPDCDDIEFSSQEAELDARKKLAIQVRREEGLFHLAIGQERKDLKELELAEQSWKSAKEAFVDARLGIQRWFPYDKEWIMDVGVNIAEAYIEIGTRDLLAEAEDLLNIQVEKLKSESQGDLQRAWDVEYKLAICWLKGNKSRVLKAVDSFRRLLERYSGQHGEHHDKTRECACQLASALVEAGRRDEARALAVKYPSIPPIAKDTSGNWVIPWIVGIVGFVTSTVDLITRQ